MSRKNIVAANWKMNLEHQDAISLFKAMCEMQNKEGSIVVVAPPTLYLSEFSKITTDTIALAAQNCSAEDNGAFTGEISASMLKEIGVKYVILGHSERRELFHEHDELIALKVKKVLNVGLKPIFCCGELLEERENKEQEMVIANQIRLGLFDLTATDLANVVIAYEPVWAIGTGKTASPEQAQEMHSFIRSFIANRYGKEMADGISILYGGSVKPANAPSIFAHNDVDGGLIGGASLNLDAFAAVIAAV